MDKDDISVGTGLVGAPACGDVMKLQVGDIHIQSNLSITATLGQMTVTSVGRWLEGTGVNMTAVLERGTIFFIEKNALCSIKIPNTIKSISVKQKPNRNGDQQCEV